MEPSGIMGFVYKIADWITKIVYLNLLWLLFTFVGLIAFGLFPATTAMFAVMRHFLRGEDKDVFKTFWSYYKKDFLKSNLLGLIIVVIGGFLAVDVYILIDEKQIFLHILFYLILICCGLFTLTLFYTFPTFAHFELKVWDVLKNSLLVMFISPVQTLFMVIGSFLLFILYSYLPAAFPLSFGSLYALIMMFLGLKAFRKLAQKQEEMKEED